MNVYPRRLYSSRNNKSENFKEEFADWWKHGELEGEEIYLMVRQSERYCYSETRFTESRL